MDEELTAVRPQPLPDTSSSSSETPPPQHNGSGPTPILPPSPLQPTSLVGGGGGLFEGLVAKEPPVSQPPPPPPTTTTTTILEDPRSSPAPPPSTEDDDDPMGVETTPKQSNAHSAATAMANTRLLHLDHRNSPPPVAPPLVVRSGHRQQEEEEEGEHQSSERGLADGGHRHRASDNPTAAGPTAAVGPVPASTPVTDKLLGLLDRPSHPPPPPSPSSSVASPPLRPSGPPHGSPSLSSSSSPLPPNRPTAPESGPSASTSSTSGWLGGWFSTPPPGVVPPASTSTAADTHETPPPTALPSAMELETETETELDNEPEEVPTVPTDEEERSQSDPTPPSRSPPVLSDDERQALDEAFQPDHPSIPPPTTEEGNHHHKSPPPSSVKLASTDRTAVPASEERATTAAATPSAPRSSSSHLKSSVGRRGSGGRVHPQTPIPHADVALRLVRKFVYKTQSTVVTTYGGIKPRSILSYLFAQKDDPTFVPYRDLVELVFDPDEDRTMHDDPHHSDDHEHQNHSMGDGSESDQIVGSILGASPGDTAARAKSAVAAFVLLVGTWGHASSTWLDEHASTKHKSAREDFSRLLSSALDAATQLVAHGCLDGVWIAVGPAAAAVGDDDDDANPDPSTAGQGEYLRAVHMLAESVFNADLAHDRNELSALKFLLTTGCRVTPQGDALLRGSHLLQTVRTLYHVYLTTESRPNKTTARAALQQLVTGVFARLVAHTAEAAIEADFAVGGEEGVGGMDARPTSPIVTTTSWSSAKTETFPSENHRDAFLVLRSICKLSMRSLPDAKSGRYSHVGLQTSGSNDTWDGGRSTLKGGSDRGNSAGTGGGGTRLTDGSERSHSQSGADHSHEPAQLIFTAAIHPALESKLLALELLLYVLQRTDFSLAFIQRCGPQFHAAIRNYLCVSLLKNCTSDDTRVVNLSLRIFVPLVRSFRTILKSEIEAFVTNVFFVILDSANTPAEHKSLVVKTFDEICSDPSALAEIFLNYDCDLSAVDLFHRIVNTLSKVSRTGLHEPRAGGMGFMGGASAARMEKFRSENRELRLDAMRALRQVLASLHASIVEPLVASPRDDLLVPSLRRETTGSDDGSVGAEPGNGKQNLVEIYDSKKRRRAEVSEAILRFNQKPSAGIAYAAKCGHVDGEDPADVARYLLLHKDNFEKAQIGEYVGREPEYQNGFSLKVLHEYVRLMDFADLLFDEAIRYFLSGFRLPGEAQKIDRIMEKFAERYTEQNRDVFPTADAAFILSFSIIMLNTDLHNPAIKEERRMTKEGFIRNNRGICDGQDLPEELLSSIFDRIKASPISLKEDDEARERIGTSKAGAGLPTGLNPASFFSSHYDEMDRARESNFQKERDHIVRTTESLLKRRRQSSDLHGKAQPKAKMGKSPKAVSKFVMTTDSGLRDEYVTPMFEVAWGPALAAFSTAMESANGTIGSLISIASDDELELAAENAAETIEVCLTGFRFAICTAGLCGNDTARDAYMLALSRFSQLGTGCLLEARHVRCIQTMLSLARVDGELLGGSWEHVFRALSEINRFHQLFHLMARNDRAAATAAERRRRRLNEKEKRRKEKEERKAAAEDGESIGEPLDDDGLSEGEDSLAESDLFSDEDDLLLEEDMDAKAIDEANARVVYDAVSETLIEAIYERSSSLSAHAAKDFVTHLCIVSRNEISVGGDHKKDLNSVTYRQQHALLSSNGAGHDQFHHSQPNIYNLQKLVEVTHYNMESRPRLIFAELWTIVSEHLTTTALHSNPAIAMYAVDSFRQLSIQYLQRDELEVFEFQRRFLKPLEVVMARSKQSSTKELLLDCVDRLIHVFSAEEPSSDASPRKGGLKSGWVPILSILGLGGRDENYDIAKTSLLILKGELNQCLAMPDLPAVLLNEHFVEVVDALLLHLQGPHADFSLDALEQLSRLAGYLADDRAALPQLKRKACATLHAANVDTKQELELWWPMLLGMSKSLGDSRLEVRTRALHTLMDIIVRHFFPPTEDSGTSKRSKLNEDLQNLQLIFRGVLFPILEFAEFGTQGGPTPSLPSDFQRFLSVPKQAKAKDEEIDDGKAYSGWLETTFDPFMDACIALCLRSVGSFGVDSLVDEIFALLNACLQSDSGLLAVKGLHRLEQFVTSDLHSDALTDDCWATVSHMLRRCLAVRDLPRPPGAVTEDSDDGEDEPDYEQAVREFVAEECMLSDRRFIGSNATNVIGLLLCSDRFLIGLRWRLFLINGLGHAIVEWEQAADILEANKASADERSVIPPDYCETAVYGRMWMNRFVLNLASRKDVVQAPPDADLKANRPAAGQKLVMDETQRLLAAFLHRERAVAQQYRPSDRDESLLRHFTALVTELLSGYNKMDGEHLKDMAWINPVLLGSCIQSKNEEIRLSVQRLVQRTSPTPNPYPIPVRPSPSKEEQETAPDTVVAVAEEVGSNENSEVAAAATAEDSEVLSVDELTAGARSLEEKGSGDPAPAAAETDESGAHDRACAGSTVDELAATPSDERTVSPVEDPPAAAAVPAPEPTSNPASAEPRPATAAPAESWNPLSWFGSSSAETESFDDEDDEDYVPGSSSSDGGDDDDDVVDDEVESNDEEGNNLPGDDNDNDDHEVATDADHNEEGPGPAPAEKLPPDGARVVD